MRRQLWLVIFLVFMGASFMVFRNASVKKAEKKETNAPTGAASSAQLSGNIITQEVCPPCYVPGQAYSTIQKYPLLVSEYYVKTTDRAYSRFSPASIYCEKRSKELKERHSRVLEDLISRNKTYFVSVLLSEQDNSFARWYTQFSNFLSFFPKGKIFVSIIEFNSNDLTPVW